MTGPDPRLEAAAGALCRNVMPRCTRTTDAACTKCTLTAARILAAADAVDPRDQRIAQLETDLRGMLEWAYSDSRKSQTCPVPKGDLT